MDTKTCKMLGFTKPYNRRSKQREISDKYAHVQREKQVQTLLTQRQKQSVYTFFHSDKSLSIDSNSRHLINVMIDNVTERHVGRVWNVSTINDQYALFLESETIEEFIVIYGSDFIIPSQSFFSQNQCYCIKNPMMQPCVDIINSTLLHLMRALSKYIRLNKSVKELLNGTSWARLLSGHVEDLVDSCCCPRVPYSLLNNGAGSSSQIPPFTP